jgi:hypothetical protein
MGIRLNLTASRQADKMRLQAAKRKQAREHRQWHLDRADAMRTEANRIMAYIAAHEDDMGELEAKAAEQMATELKTGAIAEENGKCMEDTPHG